MVIVAAIAVKTDIIIVPDTVLVNNVTIGFHPFSIFSMECHKVLVVFVPVQEHHLLEWPVNKK